MKFSVLAAFVSMAFIEIDTCKTIQKILESGKGIEWKDRAIEEEINAEIWWGARETTRRVEGDLTFINCTFHQNFLFENKNGGRWKFTGDVRFINCVFESDFQLNDVILEGRLVIEDCTFNKNMEVSRTTVWSSARIQNNRTGNDLIMAYSTFYGDLNTMSNEVGRHALMQGLSVRGNAQLSSLTCLGLDLSKSHFHQECSLNYLKFGKKAQLTSIHLHEDFTMIDAEGTGTIDTTGTFILGRTTFSEKTEQAIQ